MEFKKEFIFISVIFLFNCGFVKCANAIVNLLKYPDSFTQLAEILKEIRANEYAKNIQDAFTVYQKPLIKMSLKTIDGQLCGCIVNIPSGREEIEKLWWRYSMSKAHKCNKIQCDPNHCSKISCLFNHGPNRYLDQNPQAKVESDSDSD